MIKTVRIEDKGIPAFLSVITDITERKAAEDALSRLNNKLTILSSITRHDIKNQLMALSTYLELSKENLDNVPAASEYIRNGMEIAQTMGQPDRFHQSLRGYGNNSSRLAEHQCKCPAGSCRPAHAGCTGGGRPVGS